MTRGGAGAKADWQALGEFIRTQRQLAQLSLRQVAEMAKISNPYLSQIERGVYKPSAEVLKAVADALHISAENMYAQVGLLDGEEVERPGGVEVAIRQDDRLTREQKAALLSVYRGFVSSER